MNLNFKSSQDENNTKINSNKTVVISDVLRMLRNKELLDQYVLVAFAQFAHASIMQAHELNSIPLFL